MTTTKHFHIVAQRSDGAGAKLYLCLINSRGNPMTGSKSLGLGQLVRMTERRDDVGYLKPGEYGLGWTAGGAGQIGISDKSEAQVLLDRLLDDKHVHATTLATGAATLYELSQPMQELRSLMSTLNGMPKGNENHTLHIYIEEVVYSEHKREGRLVSLGYAHTDPYQAMLIAPIPKT